MKFYVCETCGNFVGMIKEAGVPMMCCGKKMKEIVPEYKSKVSKYEILDK